MKYKCPNCDKAIFNRRLSHCEFCDFELPQELLLSNAEKIKLDNEYKAAQLNTSRQRLSKDVGYSGVTESNEVSFLLGEPSLRARAARQCIKCGLPVSEDFEECPYCFGKNESEVNKAKVTYQQEMKLVQGLGKYFIIAFVIVALIMLSAFAI
ncbi:hypothetical protein DK924_07545 [Pseudoalteromonas sp. meg-B1]|nr:hypothetical protein DK924_07545 [Pseudoalteromonas sp. meg-B1]